MKQNYQTYREFLTDLIKETNKVISLIPKENDVSQYHYDIVGTLHKFKDIYAENQKLKLKLSNIKEGE